jgi:sugar lactone lactonase YvrE
MEVPDTIEGLEVMGDGIVVAVQGGILVYDRTGGLTGNFAVRSRVRDLASADGLLYVLYPDGVEVYDPEGEQVREWETDDASVDFCSMTVVGGSVFVTDAGNKNIRKYTSDGEFVRTIESPDRFIVPSYSFGITHTEDAIYCSNPGRHRVESYSLDGEFLGSFGRPGGGEGMFVGCCNPVHLSVSPAGEIIASEKGVPRISCYAADGRFRSVLLDDRALGGENPGNGAKAGGVTARRVRIEGEKIIVAGGERVSVFRYDPAFAAETACGRCNVSCPLRTTLT